MPMATQVRSKLRNNHNVAGARADGRIAPRAYITLARLIWLNGGDEHRIEGRVRHDHP